MTGNSISLYRKDDRTLLIEQVVAADEVEVIKLTPAHLRIIRDSEILKHCSSKHLKRFIVGGAQLETSLALAIHGKYRGQVEIYNEYGPTEATVGCMVYKFDPGQRLASVPIGGPVSNMQVYIPDKSRQPVAVGVQGELYISGEGLASGYFRHSALTREKFIDNPFSEGRKMYKTEDVVMRLPDGNVLYKGRGKEQKQQLRQRLDQ